MKNTVDIRIVSNIKEYTDAMFVRRSVFVDEQKIAPENEFDGNDFNASHVIAYVDDNPVGTMRLRYFSEFVKIERLCVLKDLRKTNVSDLIIRAGLSFCAQKGYEHAHAICKKELLGRWAKEGFSPVEGALSVEQNGMTLIPIEKKLERPEHYITIQTSPEILNLKEGEWFRQQSVRQTKELNRERQIHRFTTVKENIRKLKMANNLESMKWHPPLRCDFLDFADIKDL